MRLCSEAGCGKKHYGRGWCEKHYNRWYHNGHLRSQYAEHGTGHISLGYRIHTKGGKQKREHIAVAERALGRPLPSGAVVHHVNEDKLDNRPSNLVICPNQAYHALLHRRMRALDACGHADWRKCWICQHWDAPENLHTTPGGNVYHNCCNRDRLRTQSRKAP